MKKNTFKKDAAIITVHESFLTRVSHYIRRVGMMAMVGALALAGTSGFAADCTNKGILDYLKTAGGAWGAKCDLGAPAKSVGAIVGSVIQVFLGFLGIIFLILTLYAGFLWMTAGGKKDKVAEAQNILKAAVVGLFIIVAAQGLTYWILSVTATAVTGK